MKLLGLPFAALSMLAACGPSDSPASDPIRKVVDSRNAALLFVADSEQLSNSEVALRDRLQRSGYEIDLATQTDAWIAAGHQVELIVVGASANRSDCDRLVSSNTPMVVMDTECLEDLRMARINSLQVSHDTEFTFQIEHSLAAGLAGTLRIGSTKSLVYDTALGEGAIAVAGRAGAPESATLFAYEVDAQLLSKQARARRVGLLAGRAEHFSLDGWQLFDASVRWAAQARALVVIDQDTPTASEEKLLARLADPLGFTTQVLSVRSDRKVLTDAAERARFVVLSHSQAAAEIAGDLYGLRVPIMSMEPSALGNLNMLATRKAGDFGTEQALDTLLRPVSDHLLGVEAEETLALTTASTSVGWATPRQEAFVVATLDNTAHSPALFAVDTIDVAEDAEASAVAARRFAFLVGPDAFESFSPEAWRLFDRSARWSARIYDPRLPCMGRPDGASCSDDDACNGVEFCELERCVAGPIEEDDLAAQTCAIEASPELTHSDSPVSLVATHACAPDTDVVFAGGLVELDEAVSFQVPQALALRVGNAGNASALFRYTDALGELVSCHYQGAADVAHPVSELEIAKGREYRFESCSNGLLAGATDASTWFALDIQGSDCETAPWTSELELSLGTTGCSAQLPDPISAVDSVLMRDSFSWQHTREVAEIDASGRPSLYHALVYIRDREERSFLDDLMIHHSLMPLFNSERSKYAGQCGSIAFEGDGEGLFVYAILPGVTYNLLRKYALSAKSQAGDQEVFRAVRLTRPQDPGVLNVDGSLSYDALGASGFRYRNQELPLETGSQAMFVSGLIRAVVNAVAEIAKGTVREIQTGLGKVAVFVGVDAVPFYVELSIFNRDAAFDLNQTLVSGWNQGREVTLPGVRIEIDQYIGGALPVKFYGHTDNEGRLQGVSVAKGRAIQSICIAAQNDAAEITSHVTETMICGFGATGYAGIGEVLLKTQAGSSPFIAAPRRSIRPGKLTFVKVNSRNKYLHTLALLTDSYQYTKTVVGKTPASIEVLKGLTANTLGKFNGGAAFVPCFGHSTTALDSMLAVLAISLGKVVGLVNPAAGAATTVAVEAFFLASSAAIAVDMILPANNEVDAFSSRGIAVHEYGHVVFCDLLYKAGQGSVYTDMMKSRMLEEGGQGEGHLGAVNEAFADYFSGQVAGGVNYFLPSDANTKEDDNIHWCHDDRPLTTASSSACFDNNLSDSADFSDMVGKLASTLHDGFDGNTLGYLPEHPNDAAMWEVNGDDKFTYTDSFDGNARDEAVQMTGSCLYTVVENFAKRLETLRGDRAFLAGLADAMSASSCSRSGLPTPTWCERCVLFANHEEGIDEQNSLQDKYFECTGDSLADIVGAPPAEVSHLSYGCQVCPPNYRSADGLNCEPDVDCPASAPIPVFHSALQEWTCQQDCPSGFHFYPPEDRCVSDRVID